MAPTWASPSRSRWSTCRQPRPAAPRGLRRGARQAPADARDAHAVRPTATSAADFPPPFEPEIQPRRTDDHDVHPDHEWINIEDHEAAVVGITRMRRTRWATWSSSTCLRSGDLQEGRGRRRGRVVKAAADIYMPVEGEVVGQRRAARRPGAGQQRPDGQRLVLQGPRHAHGPVRRADGPARYDKLLKSPVPFAPVLPPHADVRARSPLALNLENAAEFAIWKRRIGPSAGRRRWPR